MSANQLVKPAEEHLRVEPELICEGKNNSSDIRVLLYTQCQNETCKSHIEARIWTN